MHLIAYRPSGALLNLVAALNGQWTGYRAMCRCPAHADNTPSLSIRQGDRGILVHCFAGCDTIDVLRELNRVSRIPMPAAPNLNNREQRQRSRANVERLWQEGRNVAGTLAEVYLEHRGIDPGTRDLRFHPRCPKGPNPTTQYLPTMLVAVRDDTQLTAIQRIFLAGDGQYTDKLMLGQPASGAWRGTQPAQDRLAIAEGFETAARFTKLTGIPCWATLGAARLSMLTLPNNLTDLVIAEDNDAEGRAAATRAIDAYTRTGLTITRMPPSALRGQVQPKDWAASS